MPDTNPAISKSWPLASPPTFGSSVPLQMQALTIHRGQYGPPARAIRLEMVLTPVLGPMDGAKVLVAILATGPNFNTNFAALGLPVPVFGRGDDATVHIPGSDALGIVVDTGLAVTRVKVGQAVVLDSWTGRNIRGYESHDGFNAQFVAIPEDRVILLPGALQSLPPERLAAILLTYGTAYRAVTERLRVSPGNSVLVMGGGKGTSFAGAQIAGTAGAHVILMGSNTALASSLISRGLADAFVDRTTIPPTAFGPIEPGETPTSWWDRSEPFRAAVFAANGGRPVDKIFEHTGAENFPLLVSSLVDGGAIAFFGATGKGLKGEYRETFFFEGSRLVFDARWVWMRQKQILFRKKSPDAIFNEIGLLPGRRGMIWGADAYARSFVRAALRRGSEIAVIASFGRDRKEIAELVRMGVPENRVIDRDTLEIPPDMPDPLTADGRPNPAYASGFMKPAQALGKALWGIFGGRQSPDFIVERTDQSTLHMSAFVLRDFDENDAMPCGFIVGRAKKELTIAGSHMYNAAQAGEVIRLLASGKIVMEQDDIEVTDLPGLPAVQQKMLEGKMTRPKGVALVQADRPERPISSYEEAYLGESIRVADPKRRQYLDVRLADGIALLTLTRPDALNALNTDLLSQLGAVFRQLHTTGTIDGRRVAAVVIRGAGRAFVAGADVSEFLGKTAEAIHGLAAMNIGVFTEIESLPIPVIALVDGYALGGGNELAMSAHYRIATENAIFGQPEVKLGIIPGYGGMQRLPRLIGPARAALLCCNGEPIDGKAAVAMGLADVLRPSSRALVDAVQAARGFASGTAPLLRRNWDELAAGQANEISSVINAPGIRDVLSAQPPDAAGAKDLRAARLAAASVAVSAMLYGYRNGFPAGLANDAHFFGEITASPGGQEWIGRFLAKDPLQSYSMTILPSLEGT